MRALACLLCLAACDAGAKPEPPAPAPKKINATSNVTTTPVKSSAFNLDYLPADSDVIVHVDVARMRKSKLWPSYSHDVAKLVIAGFSGCDYDPMTQITSVDIGIPIASGQNVFVIRGIDREKSLACFHRIEKEPDRSKFDGDYFTLTSLGRTRVMTFVDAHTLVMQGTNKPTKQTLQRAIEGGAPLAKNTELGAAINRAVSEAAVTAISRPGSQELAKQNQTGVKFASFYASLDLTERLSLYYVMDMYSPEDATSVLNMMKSQLDTAAIKQLFDHIDTRSQDKTVMLTVELGETKLASLAGMVRGMIPEP